MSVCIAKKLLCNKTKQVVAIVSDSSQRTIGYGFYYPEAEKVFGPLVRPYKIKYGPNIYIFFMEEAWGLEKTLFWSDPHCGYRSYIPLQMTQRVKEHIDNTVFKIHSDFHQ